MGSLPGSHDYGRQSTRRFLHGGRRPGDDHRFREPPHHCSKQEHREAVTEVTATDTERYVKGLCRSSAAGFEPKASWSQTTLAA